MSHQLLSLSCDAPVNNLQDVLGNFEGAQIGLRKLRDRLVDSGEQGLAEETSIFLGLYLSYTDGLIMKLYEEMRSQPPSAKKWKPAPIETT
ncbi:MAG TPA: hypothetical protein PKI21_03260 [Nitrospira sp.]|jgi:hypothetical protein|nr:hypothetical protein [Nitrospira sp.]HPV82283.1 hypothetical protein [Nitrospira sp.]